jgi:hypothetical protein
MMKTRKHILIGIAIIALILTAVGVLTNLFGRSHFRPGPTLITIGNMRGDILSFEAETGRYPTSLDELRCSGTNSGSGLFDHSWTNHFTDEWGHRIRYRAFDRHDVKVVRFKDGYTVSQGGTDTWHTFELRSAGPDGIFDTIDDIWH